MNPRLIRCGLLALALACLPVTMYADACANCAISCAQGKTAGCSCCGGDGDVVHPPKDTGKNLHEFVGSQIISPDSDIIDVDVRNFEFADRDIEINLGDTVRWTVSSGFHTVTSDADAWVSSGGFGVGDGAFEVTFNLPGTYLYYCEFHGAPGELGMAGSITVVPEPRISILVLLGIAASCVVTRFRLRPGRNS